MDKPGILERSGSARQPTLPKYSNPLGPSNDQQRNQTSDSIIDPPLLIAIDIQREYTPVGRPYYINGVEPSVENCRRILSHARDQRWPVAHVRHVQADMSSTKRWNIRVLSRVSSRGRTGSFSPRTTSPATAIQPLASSSNLRNEVRFTSSATTP